MRLHILVLGCLLFCSACANPNANDKKTSMGNSIEGIKIELYLYPTGNFNDIRYAVIVDGGMLTIENRDTLVGTKIPYNLSKQELTSAQLKKLEGLIKETKFVKEDVALIAEDTWECKLIANSSLLYENPCFTYESQKGKQNLLSYLLSLLPVKLELYGFS